MRLSEFKPTEEVLERVSKCTTAEEVEKLAREYDVELTEEEIAEVMKYNNLKELDAEQLDLVAGGDWAKEKSRYLPANRGAYISKYAADNYEGRLVYCVRDSDPKQYGWGELVYSMEEEVSWTGRTKRVHAIRFSGQSSRDATLDYWDIYSKSICTDYISGHLTFTNILGDRCTLFEYL